MQESNSSKKKVHHIGLFEGIGGFSLAVDEVFGKENVHHTLVEWDGFCQNVLKKHWPQADLHGDIRIFASHANSKGRAWSKPEFKASGHHRQSHRAGSYEEPLRTLLTGGFPCQPFSHAGRRKGTADDRYLWPPMLSVIKSLRPDWVIAENVRGLVTWNEGLVLETVCADLEAEGYEVQPLVIPACAVGAPHRRDRVWIIAHLVRRADGGTSGEDAGKSEAERVQEWHAVRKPRVADRFQDWNADWREVALTTCIHGMDDGLPKRMARLPDGSLISEARLRRESLKAYGNAIVPQVAMEILDAIKATLS